MRFLLVGFERSELYGLGHPTMWTHFALRLEALGHEVVTDVHPDRAPDALVSLNHHKRQLRDPVVRRIPIARRFLVLWEPPAVMPAMYSRTVLSAYGTLLSPSPLRAQNWGALSFPHPQEWPEVCPISDMPRARNAVVMQANKFSFVTGEQYSLRRRVIRRAEMNSLPIVTYGQGWDASLFKRLRWSVHAARASVPHARVPAGTGWAALSVRPVDYRGVAPSKQAALSGHCLSLVIENFSDYVSEKLFDAILAGTVAIYVGPDLLAMGLPPSLALTAPPVDEAIVSLAMEVLNKPADEIARLQSTQREAADSVAALLRPDVIGRDLALVVCEAL